ncbi:MAG: hypothetical protein KKG99_06030 [Bacteroidetes bacterium]|nr:hypothetical protein [Bacteroidota bacterium]
MERTTTIDEAKAIMGTNFIGPIELALISSKMDIRVPENVPPIPFSPIELINKQKDYILILGTSQMSNGVPLTLSSMRDRFGINPDVSEPCFYNQDWYLKEDFFSTSLSVKWFLLRKSIINETRSKNPELYLQNISLPSAISCAFALFSYWHLYTKILWVNDYIWCIDTDHNGDRIYVGRYIDPEGKNKNGFSVHRHLNIRNNYGCIDTL